MRIAVMQPYFIPYAGYFRLFTSCDVFVIYDCVQFPRRGWVHRNQLTHQNGQLDWLTLPLKKAPQQIAIQDLSFVDDYLIKFKNRCQPFTYLRQEKFAQKGLMTLYQNLMTPAPFVDYLSTTLEEICRVLSLPYRTLRSSSFDIPSSITGQERILAICRALGATSYVNAPNGRNLYDEETFSKHHVSLHFLSPYLGPKVSILERLLYHNKRDIAHEIRSQSL